MKDLIPIIIIIVVLKITKVIDFGIPQMLKIWYCRNFDRGGKEASGKCGI